MTRLKAITIALLLLCTSTALAQRATIFQLPGGAQVVFVTLPSGQTILVTDVQVLKVPDPTPPTPVTTGLVWTVVIRTVDTMTADQSQVLSDLRQWSDQQPKDKVSHLEFSPSAVGPDGAPDKKVAAFVARIPATAKQPYVFITQNRSDGKSVVLWQSELPATADALISKIKEFAK